MLNPQDTTDSVPKVRNQIFWNSSQPDTPMIISDHDQQLLFNILLCISGSAASELSHDDDDLSSTSGASSRSHSPFPPGGTVDGERTGRVLPNVSTEVRNVKKMLWRQRRKCLGV